MTPQEIINQEYCSQADEIRKKMVLQSYYKYGEAKTNCTQNLVNIMGWLERCLGKYKRTGNTEYLLDGMNYLMFEFMYPQKEGAYYKPTDSDGSAGIEGLSCKQIKEW